MPKEKLDLSEERQYVYRRLVAIIREAEAQADLVAGFLKSKGLRAKKAIPSEKPSEAFLSGAISSYLLELGAVLRLRQWEQAQLASQLHVKFPPAHQDLAEASDRAISPHRSKKDAIALPHAIFRACHERFSHAGQSELRTSILLPSAVDIDRLTNQLAELLWKHRLVLTSINQVESKSN